MKVGSPGGLARESPSCRLACGRRAYAGALSDVVVRNRVTVPVYIERGKAAALQVGLVSPTDKENERRAARNQAYL